MVAASRDAVPADLFLEREIWISRISFISSLRSFPAFPRTSPATFRFRLHCA